MVNLLAIKMIVLIVVTNCCIVDFQYALSVLSHQDCLFLSYCGILMNINLLQHIVVPRFVQIQDSLEYMVLVLYWCCTLYNCLCELHPCTHYMGNYTKRTSSIWDICFHVYSTSIVISHWRVNNSCSAKNWFSSHFLCKPANCCGCTFLSCCYIFNKMMDFRWLCHVFS